MTTFVQKLASSSPIEDAQRREDLVMICRIITWLCRTLCPNMVFNSDMSLEIDRLTLRIEELEEILNEQ